MEFILQNLITIILVIFFVLGFIKGFGDGLLKRVFSFGSLIVTIIATKYLTPMAANFIKNVTNIEATLSDMLYNVFIETNLYNGLNIAGIEKITGTGNIGDTIKDSLCTNMANLIINLICGVVIFILVIFTFKLIIKILDVVDFIPVIGQINKIAGGLLGMVEVLLIVSLVFTIIRVLDDVPQVMVAINNIKASPIGNIIYENNIVYNFFSNIFSVFSK